MARRKPVRDFVENLTPDQLDAREALYMRLLCNAALPECIAENIHLKLCAVRAEQFARS